jgi:hypothetical protein
VLDNREVQTGDEVVIMSAPGRFTVIAIDGAALTLRNAEGMQKTVHVTGVRILAPRASSS